jgi:hypothetical protein
MSPPTPPPSPNPPTQTVVVNIPPELVDKFAPHGPSWLTGPSATLIAGLLALIGAGIAFCAVHRQINANSKSVEKQIQANAAAVARQIEAAGAHERRKERLEVVTEAAHIAHDLAGLATQHAAYGDPEWHDEPPDVAQKRVEDEFDGMQVWPTLRKLDLLGMADAVEAIQEVFSEAGRIIHPHPLYEPMESWTIYEKEEHAIATLKAALDTA